MTIESHSAVRTRELGALLGRALVPGDVVVLDGELGAGKTTFTQGVGSALAIGEPITSPTFVVAREHRTRDFVLTHVDAYRVTSLAEWDDLDIDLDEGVAIIEWGQRIAAALPADRLTITFSGDDTRRLLNVDAPGPRSARLAAALEASA